ncbi:MAG: YbaK/EbsC family protein [Clostridia bacterium]|nr:YbaK/EbsC family protein [Clostridia bacterium]
MAIEKVREYFKKFCMEEQILEFDVSSATVELAAIAVGCEPEKIAKSMTFNVNGECVMIITAGDVKIDNAKYKAEFHLKAKMLTADEALEKTGHAVGGICPFALNEGCKVYLDESLKRFQFVYPACGSSNSAIKLTPDELQKYSDSFVKWVDVCKPKQ